MTQSQHTPGPWFVFYNGYCVGGPFSPGPGDNHQQNAAGVATCGMRLRTRGEAEANARLIAAAPTLLSACEQTLHTLELTAGEACWCADLAPADGAPGPDVCPCTPCLHRRCIDVLKDAVALAKGGGR